MLQKSLLELHKQVVVGGENRSQNCSCILNSLAVSPVSSLEQVFTLIMHTKLFLLCDNISTLFTLILQHHPITQHTPHTGQECSSLCWVSAGKTGTYQLLLAWHSPAPATLTEKELCPPEEVLADVCRLQQVSVADGQLLPSRYSSYGGHLYRAAHHPSPAVRLTAVVEKSCL